MLLFLIVDDALKYGRVGDNLMSLIRKSPSGERKPVFCDLIVKAETCERFYFSCFFC